MPVPVTYEIFLANVNSNDLAVMTNFVVGGTINAADNAEADAIFNQCTRLYNAGMLSRVNRHYAEQSGQLKQSFTGVVTPAGAGYLTRLARERLVLSRDPLPEN